uniref:Putative secreted protein n=1 Tax=Xenopsylla cheopis TaxID=163159 RepID=A0A6M2E0E4_XENCH
MDFKISSCLFLIALQFSGSFQINYYGSSSSINNGQYNFQNSYPQYQYRQIKCEPIIATIEFSYLRQMLDEMGYRLIPKQDISAQNIPNADNRPILDIDVRSRANGAAKIQDDKINYPGEIQKEVTNLFELPVNDEIKYKPTQDLPTNFEQDTIQDLKRQGFPIKPPANFIRPVLSANVQAPDSKIHFKTSSDIENDKSEISHDNSNKNLKSLVYKTANGNLEDDSIYFPEDVDFEKDHGGENYRNLHSTTEKANVINADKFFYPGQHTKRVENENSKGHLNNADLTYNIYEDELTTTTIRNNLLRQIIDTGFNAPYYDANCPEGEKQDSRGVCRPVW